jgi:hypothetical protein
MALYYFDLRDGEELALDEEGLELRTMRAVQEEAARALSGIAYDAMRLDGGERQHMAIEVRDPPAPLVAPPATTTKSAAGRSLMDMAAFCAPQRPVLEPGSRRGDPATPATGSR